MELRKVMKKGLSVVLSAAMVLTSVAVGDVKKASAEDKASDVTVTVDDAKISGTIEHAPDKMVVSGTLEDGDTDTVDVDNDTVTVQLMGYWNAEDPYNSSWIIGNEGDPETAATVDGDAKTFSAEYDLSEVDASNYYYRVTYTNAANDSVAVANSKTFTLSPEFSFDMEKEAYIVGLQDEKVTIKGEVSKVGGAVADGEGTIVATADGATIPNDGKVSLTDGAFEVEVPLADLETLKMIPVTFTVASEKVSNGQTYSATVAIVPIAADAMIATTEISNDGGSYAGFPAVPEGKVSDSVVDMSKKGTYTLKFTIKSNWDSGNGYARIDFKPVTGTHEFTDEEVANIEIKSVKKNGEEVEAAADAVYLSKGDDATRFDFRLYNKYESKDNQYLGLGSENKDDFPKVGDGQEPDVIEVTFEVKEDWNVSTTPENPDNPTPENPGNNPTVDATAATVTAVTMTEPANKNVVVTASSAAVTAAAVLKLDGKELGQIATQGVVVVTTAAGVKVDVSTKAAVATKGATTATFAALFTVPANAATGSYPVYVKVATKGAAATTVGGVVGTLTINAATAAVVEEPPVVDVPGKATKSIKLAVKKATIGVKEKINVKVTTKKTAAATAAKKVTISKNSKKAVATAKISGKKLVITGKKAGKTVITVKSGKKTAKITVTVKKAPKKVSLKDGKKAAKKTVSLSAKTKKKAVSKTYTIVLPKNTASYGYTVKKSGKKAIIKKVAFKQSKAGVTNKVVVTVKKGAKGSAKVVLVSKANKKAKATIKVKATK